MNSRQFSFGAAIALALGVLGGYRLSYRWEDAYWYYQMADGKARTVIQPFAGRPLSPMLVRATHYLTHASISHSFEMVGLISFALFVAGVFFLLSKICTIQFQVMLGVSLTSFWAVTFSNYVLPDVVNGLLLLIFIVLLMKERTVEAMLMLIPLSISRESSLLIAVCIGVAAWKRVGGKVYLWGAASLWIGLKLAALLAGPTLSNRHHLNRLAYTILKIPFNFSTNILGVEPWTNTLNVCSPIVSRSIPKLGEISRVGVCSYSAHNQIKVLSGWMCEFGILGVFAVLLIPHWRKLLPQPLYLRFCVVYGIASFFLAPLIGSATDRLISYSWPLFLVAVPVMFSQIFGQKGDLFLPIALASVSSWLFFFGQVYYFPLLLPAIAVLIVAFLSARRRVTAEPARQGLVHQENNA